MSQCGCCSLCEMNWELYLSSLGSWDNQTKTLAQKKSRSTQVESSQPAETGKLDGQHCVSSTPMNCANMFSLSLLGDSLADLIKLLYNSKVPGNWKLFGVMLKVQLGLLDTIAAKYPHKPQDCLIDVLQIWLNGMNPPPSWNTLFEALEVMGEEKLAFELKEKYGLQYRKNDCAT